jgi:hypothetical protein
VNSVHEQVKREVLRLRRIYRNQHGQTPREINGGNCESFAEDLLTKFPKGDTYWGEDFPKLFRPYMSKRQVEDTAHCFFFIEGKYFDSECPEGVINPALLPYYQRCIQRMKL